MKQALWFLVALLAGCDQPKPAPRPPPSPTATAAPATATLAPTLTPIAAPTPTPSPMPTAAPTATPTPIATFVSETAKGLPPDVAILNQPTLLAGNVVQYALPTAGSATYGYTGYTIQTNPATVELHQLTDLANDVIISPSNVLNTQTGSHKYTVYVHAGSALFYDPSGKLVNNAGYFSTAWSLTL